MRLLNYKSSLQFKLSGIDTMSEAQRMAPPLSPGLLAGFALRPLPPELLQPALNAAMTAIHRNHPGIFETFKAPFL